MTNRQADPFGTAALRASVLAAWESSPTRLREDANAEEDLVLGGYRDRLLVELAQNAADAASAAGIDGTLRLSLVDGELRAANTGAELDAHGVHALASLRASAKQAGVGRFGVGFAAVLTVTDAPRVVSRTGGVAFSAARTRQAFADPPQRVPVLRLVWPADEDEPGLPEGFDTEVRLPLRSDVDGDAVLAGFAEQAVDLLLSLPGLARIEIGEAVWARLDDGPVVRLREPDGVARWLVRRADGELSEHGGLGAELRQRPQWTVCWALPVDADGVPSPVSDDVLHAPTATDERLSLPARLIATLPVEPSRRRVVPGPAVDEVLGEAAEVYPLLAQSLAPQHRTALVPLPAFPRSEVDSTLRESVLAELRVSAWLPAAGGGLVAPAKATVLDQGGTELAALLADVVPGLLDAGLAGPRHAPALSTLDVPRLRLAGVVAAVTGISRPPSWWHDLYAALAPIAETDATAREELGALPVPLLDGRTLPGPRGMLVVHADDDLAAELSEVDAAIVHPAAAHPLLERLGARRGGPVDLLESPSLRDAVQRSVDDAEAGMDVSGLAGAVLRLLAESGARAGDHPWAGALALPDEHGDPRRADELAMPDAAFLDVLAEDSPLGVLSERIAGAWPAHVLAAAGVLDAFAVLDVADPVGPEHQLADEDAWWDAQPQPPARLLAVRDLDLVDDDAWPAALRLLAGDPDAWRALHQPNGYTPWWLSRNALLAGHPPTHWRLRSATALTGLYDPVPGLGLAEPLLAAIGARQQLTVDDAADARDLLARLADPRREVRAGTALRAHEALAVAVRDGVLDPSRVDPPAAVRTLSTGVCGAADCLVVDLPWLLGALPDDRAVTAGVDFALAAPLAELLDLPLAGDELHATLASRGEPAAWSELGAAALAADLLGVELPEGGLIVHERLRVHTDDGDYDVPWWIFDDGTPHVEDSPAAIAWALAWEADAWPLRHALAALVTDPETRTYLA